MSALTEQFAGKCAYCETQVSLAGGQNLDHFRPPRSATGTGGTDPDHYWWLALEWRNLYLACAACNLAKGNVFPVYGARARIETPFDDIRERSVLIDPCAEDPEGLFVYTADGRIVAAEDRAMATIDLLNLNRPRLVAARKEAIQNLRSRLHAIERLLADGVYRGTFDEYLDPLAPYAGARRQVFAAWLASQGGRNFQHARPPSPDRLPRARTATEPRVRQVTADFEAYRGGLEHATLDTTPDERLHMKSRVIERIELVNVRGIEHLVLEPTYGDSSQAPCLALLGENGCGKTTVLQALAIALMGPQQRNRLKLRPASLLRHGTSHGWVRVQISGTEEPIEVHFRRGEDTFRSADRGAKVATMGYGAHRLLPGRGGGALKSRVARVENLFDPRAALTNPSAWLRTQHQDWFYRIAADLKELLPLEENDEFIHGKSVRIRTNGQELRLDQLSAGYQAILSLAVDVMRFNAEAWGERSAGELSSVRGVLIVDEIDAHLHPRWKIRVISDLRRLFPQVQLIVTTHDPLCLRALDAGEAVVLERDEAGRISANTELPSPRSMRIDQLLTSDYFGLASTRDAETEEELRTYQTLLAEQHRTGRRSALLDRIEERLDAKNLLGADPRERLLLRTAAEHVARNAARLGRPAERRVGDPVDEQLLAMWAATFAEPR